MKHLQLQKKALELIIVSSQIWISLKVISAADA